MGTFVELGFLVVIVAQFVLMVVLFTRNRQNSQTDVVRRLEDHARRLEKNESTLRDEFAKNREESNKLARESREELAMSILTFEGKVTQRISDFSETLGNGLKFVQERVHISTKENREELSISLKTFEEKSSAKIEMLARATREDLEKNRDAVEKKLSDIQQGNEKKLDEMRKTVDEKLHRTLEMRLGESFKLVSERLELVQKGLGEMQTLASDVGSIKNVLANVKNKGVLGEYQLGAILEQILPPAQYAQNVRIKEGSRESVEFAVKIPSKEDSSRIIWLPIDAKFPTAAYEVLLDAYESGEKETAARARRDLKIKIEEFAKSIREKYIAPPNTTEFGIMFLPFEGLYAEVLRIPGLFENIQNTHKVTITGPTTVSAFLNSLQMGFRSLAVEKRTGEIWNLLGAVREEFIKFGDVLQKTKEKLDSASREIDRAGTRSRAIERKLRDVQTLPDGRAQKLMDDVDAGNDGF
jgi:DNA recombination protein RmuC